MGEYHCEGIGSLNGGSYDNLHVEGVFSAKAPITAKNVSCEGVVNFYALSTESFTCEGVANIRGLFEAETANIEGVLNAGSITVSDTLYTDGVLNTDVLKAGSATLLYNSQKSAPRPFAKIRAFFTGKDVLNEKNARIGEIEVGTLVIEDYSVKKILGQDITIGKGCLVNMVQADTRLRIHTTATVKDLSSSVTPEYFD